MEVELFSRSRRAVHLLVLSQSSGGPSLKLCCPVCQAAWCRGTPRSSGLDCPSTGTLIGGALEMVGDKLLIHDRNLPFRSC